MRFVFAKEIERLEYERIIGIADLLRPTDTKRFEWPRKSTKGRLVVVLTVCRIDSNSIFLISIRPWAICNPSTHDIADSFLGYFFNCNRNWNVAILLSFDFVSTIWIEICSTNQRSYNSSGLHLFTYNIWENFYSNSISEFTQISSVMTNETFCSCNCGRLKNGKLFRMRVTKI